MTPPASMVALMMGGGWLLLVVAMLFFDWLGYEMDRLQQAADEAKRLPRAQAKSREG